MDEAEEAAVVEVIRSKRLHRGGVYPEPGGTPKVYEFERAFAEKMGSEHALAVNSGTSALACAYAALGIGPGDEVIVPAYTWLATATAALAVGAAPVIAEIDESLNLDPSDVRAKLSPHTKAIAAVHMRGAPAAMDELSELAREHDLYLVEDTAQAVGASYRGRRLGTIGDVGAYSFGISKMITAGAGGMVVTNAEDLYRQAAMYHDVASISYFGVSGDEWLVGHNFRMPELVAAVMLVQLSRLDGILADMRANKAKLTRLIEPALRDHGVTFRTIHDPEGEAASTMILLLPPGARSSHFVSALALDNIPAEPLYLEGAELRGSQPHVYVEWRPILEKRGWAGNRDLWKHHPRPIDYTEDACPRSLEILRRGVMFDISPDLSERQVEQMGAGIVEAVKKLR
jgi:dTDP-4-amino-4,6-dideoxygalactose transaminase